VFEYTFDDCYYFMNNLMSLKASKCPFIKRFITDPVLFLQAVCLRACDTERFDPEVSNEFVLLMHAEHPDFGDSPNVVEMSCDGDVEAGEAESSSDPKLVSKKTTFGNNIIKCACCVPLRLRHTLLEVLPKFSQKLFSNVDVGSVLCQPCDLAAVFGEQYLIFFGSVFYLDVMRAREHLKGSVPDFKEYVRACARISFEFDSNQGSICLEVPWQDMVLAARASDFLPPEAQPRLSDWMNMLASVANERDVQQELAALLTVDVLLYREKWTELDRAYASPSKGFFDFEKNAKIVFQNCLLKGQGPLQIFSTFDTFDRWWSAVLNLRDGAARDASDCEYLQLLAPGYAAAEYWNSSAKALWLLEIIQYAREIMLEEYDRKRVSKPLGAKRALEDVNPPITFREFFEFVCSEIMGFDAADKKELMLVYPASAKAMIFRNFHEWLEDYERSNTSQLNR
jgi:hypothetical protein